MATIFGAIGLEDNERVFVGTVGQDVVWDVVNEAVREYNETLDSITAIFIDRAIEEHTIKYKLPAYGRMSKRGIQSRGPAIKQSGSWTISLPLEDFQEAVVGDDVSRAHMTAAGLELSIRGIFFRHTDAVRYEILRKLLNNVAYTFVSDDDTPDLTISPLANGDATVYPPVLGSTTEATDDHYLESGYATASISDTNNPVRVIVEEINEHFGSQTGGENVAIFINPDEKSAIEGLTDFDRIPDRFIRVGDNVDVPQMLPSVPGTILGRANGAWIVEWRWMPAKYMTGIHLEAAPPMLMRNDPADTGLPSVLTMITTNFTHPFVGAEWRHRFGLGVGNRLNGVTMEMGTGGTYTVPDGY